MKRKRKINRTHRTFQRLGMAGAAACLLTTLGSCGRETIETTITSSDPDFEVQVPQDTPTPEQQDKPPNGFLWSDQAVGWLEQAKTLLRSYQVGEGIFVGGVDSGRDSWIVEISGDPDSLSLDLASSSSSEAPFTEDLRVEQYFATGDLKMRVKPNDRDLPYLHPWTESISIPKILFATAIGGSSEDVMVTCPFGRLQQLSSEAAEAIYYEIPASHLSKQEKAALDFVVDECDGHYARAGDSFVFAELPSPLIVPEGRLALIEVLGRRQARHFASELTASDRLNGIRGAGRIVVGIQGHARSRFGRFGVRFEGPNQGSSIEYLGNPTKVLERIDLADDRWSAWEGPYRLHVEYGYAVDAQGNVKLTSRHASVKGFYHGSLHIDPLGGSLVWDSELPRRLAASMEQRPELSSRELEKIIAHPDLDAGGSGDLLPLDYDPERHPFLSVLRGEG